MQRQSIAAQAKRYPELVFNNVFPLIDRECLLEAYRQTRKRSAPGVDQVTAKQYADTLDDNLRDLHERLRATRYVAPPVERVWIEKEDGKKRPRGNACVEDKIVQRAVVMIVEAIFEPALHVCSHGFSKGHSQHQARHELREQGRKLNIAWIVAADVRGFFDNLAWGHLRECLQQRGSDGGIVRLLGKWRHAGVLESGELTSPDKGAPQGGVRSPMVSNVFLPRVLDAWFVKAVPPRMPGRCFVTRFADAFLIGFALAADAHRVRAVFPKRFARFRLTMHPEKPVLTEFKRPPRRDQSAGGKGPCACLGCTHYWATTRRGDGVIKRKTVGKRLRRLMKGIWTWCREKRQEPLKAPDQTLCLKLRGYYQYYGIRGNVKMLDVACEHTERAWQYWLSRRSHKGHINWQKFVAFVHRKLPLPQPRIIHHIEQRLGQQSYAPNGVSPVWLAISGSFWATEEPDEGNLHVRICGEGAGYPVPLPGSRRQTASAALPLPAAPDAWR